MGFPAARITDKTIHLGTIATGRMDVLIGGKPAARITDVHACAFHPPNVVIPPCAYNVLTGNLPQARILDKCACTAMIITGKFNVLVGTDGGQIFGMDVVLQPDGSIKVGDHMVIKPNATDPGFLGQTLGALATLGQTPTGQNIFNALNGSGHTVTIQATSDANGYAQAMDASGYQNPAKGSDSTVSWNPYHNTVDAASGDSPGSTVILGHEMIHATHNATGTNANGPQYTYDSQSGSSSLGEERSTFGAAGTQVLDPGGNPVPVTDYSGSNMTENSLRDDLGIGRRPTYYPSNWAGGPPW